MWRACLNLDNVSCLKMSFPKREFRFIPLEEEKKKKKAISYKNLKRLGILC